MAISLYDVTVRSFLQTVGAVAAILDKGLAYCQARNIDPAEVVESRVHPDMFPFRFQVISVCHHSLGAIEGVRKGQFGPPPDLGLLDYAGLQSLVADARSALQAMAPAEIDALAEADVIFHLRDFKLPFTAAGFLTSFSLPNLHFHATTAYDILRAKGAPLGKRDYMGALWLKT